MSKAEKTTKTHLERFGGFCFVMESAPKQSQSFLHSLNKYLLRSCGEQDVVLALMELAAEWESQAQPPQCNQPLGMEILSKALWEQTPDLTVGARCGAVGVLRKLPSRR